MSGRDTTATVLTLTPEWSVAKQVHAHSTTRLGGISQPPFDALNLARHSGDDPAAVQENRQRLRHALNLPEEPVWMQQVHGVDVLQVTDDPVVVMPTADAAFTRMPGRVLVAMTADCLPVVIADTAGTQIAVAHAGWRGLADGVLENTLACFKPGSTLQAWLAPAIGPQAFEVGAEVRERFVTDNPLAAGAFVARPGQPGKYLADLYALACQRLVAAHPGITLTGGEHCTFSEPDRFHSYRRDGAASGRMGTLVWIGVIETHARNTTIGSSSRIL